MDLLRSIILDWLTNLINDTYLSELMTKCAMIVIWVFIGYLGHFTAKLFLFILRRANKKTLIKRQRTIAALVVSLIKYVFWFVIIMMILLELGIDLAPILASAGILGFAIGFGAQELIKDLISGFFIIFEESFNVGDMIRVGDFTGTVVEIGIRKTKIKSWKNEMRLINNGDIRVLTNFSLDDSVGVVEFHVTPYFDLKTFYEEPFQELLATYAHDPNVTEPPQFIGVVETTLHMITCRVTFQTKPGMHFGLERALKRDIQLYLNGLRNT